MKTFNSNIKFSFFLVLIISLTSCLNDQFDELQKNSIPSGFEFKTTNPVQVTITTLNGGNLPISNVQIQLYSKNPLNSDGTLVADYLNNLLYKGSTDLGGNFSCSISPATTVDSLIVLVNHTGLPNYHAIKLTSSDIKLQIGGTTASKAKYKVAASTSVDIPITGRTANNEFLILGSWNNSGVPNYIIGNDVISNDFLTDVNASLPERIQLPTSHPEYFTGTDDGSLVLEKDAEVWVTFVHEGAGYMNSLAYYTHPNGLAPITKAEIKDQTIIFPNVSYSGSGGGLASGNKVQLFYYNQTTLKYSNIFPAGTTVCWLLRSNAWTGTTVGTGYNNFYSDAKFNPEKLDINKKHNVVLKDVTRKLFLLGFEDLHRENGSDNDFNDAVFYATVSPYEAVRGALYQSIDSPKDMDNDGVPDSSDDYPADKLKAYKNYYPGINQVGTLAFEDLWPYKGDYDFNDLIVDYNFNQITNAQNQTVEIEAQLTVRAIGASFKNGFGIELNTTADNVLSVSGQKLTEGIINLASNGTETGQQKAVIIAFDNAFSVTPHPGNGLSVNTVVNQAYQTPGIINLKIVFKNPVSYSQIGTAPYNPFIFINATRSHEVHLSGSTPTNLANLSLFGTGNDNSDLNKAKYYMSDKYLPWAINFPAKFDYPSEKEDITKAYYNFNKWTASSGFNYMDWYLNKAGYRDDTKLFRK